MIRLNKPVKLLEWGLGTSTVTQCWSEIGKGKIRSAKRKDGVTKVIIDLDAPLNRKNEKNESVKIAQLGEAMTPTDSQAWGEVAMGKLASVDSSSVVVDVDFATKVQ